MPGRELSLKDAAAARRVAYTVARGSLNLQLKTGIVYLDPRIPARLLDRWKVLLGRPTVLAYVRSLSERWREAPGADCADPATLAAHLGLRQYEDVVRLTIVKEAVAAVGSADQLTPR